MEVQTVALPIVAEPVQPRYIRYATQRATAEMCGDGQTLHHSDYTVHHNSPEVESSHVNRKGMNPEHIRHDRNNGVLMDS